ncbi:large ribosomal subunit protein mL37 [Paroedura picta]|uniref:large ribosomal subunit protein mL37 n=1 Tax=Paroedura picta TaxID=143630 RepID=UPI004056D46B
MTAVANLARRLGRSRRPCLAGLPSGSAPRHRRRPASSPGRLSARSPRQQGPAALRLRTPPPSPACLSRRAAWPPLSGGRGREGGAEAGAEAAAAPAAAAGMLLWRGSARRAAACLPSGGQRRSKTQQSRPRRPTGPLPRTPWTVRGPPPGAPLPWYLREVPSVREQVPELDVVTYEGKMHHVPWLAKPRFEKWERGWHDPLHDGRQPDDRPVPKERPCFLFQQPTCLLEGVKQASWLTKTKVIDGLPLQILSIMTDAANQLENQDERVQNAMTHARFWVSNEEKIMEKTYCPVLLEDLLQLCRIMVTKHPLLAKRMMAQDYSMTATWERESILLQVRGINGKLLNAMSPLEPAGSKEEILATENDVLETLYPIAPTIDLQEVNIYETQNDTGFQAGYPYPYPHTIYFADGDECHKMIPEELRAKMMLFAFGNALAKARVLYGDEPKVLEKPIVVQSVGTDGQTFQFMVFQLNTTDLDPSHGVKNLAWIDADQLLYEEVRHRPQIRRKVITIPVGVHGYQPATFKKFLAFYLNGVV